MRLIVYFKKHFWRVFIQTIFYILCIFILYRLYHAEPKPPVLLLVKPQIIPASNPLVFGEGYYDVKINGYDTNHIALFVREKNGNTWISAKDLTALNLIVPPVAPVTYGEEKYYSLKQFPGLTFTVDTHKMVINMNAPFKLFSGTQIDGNASKFLKFDYPSPGAFFNYNLYETRNISAPPHYQFSNLFTIGVFNRLGVGTTSFMTQNASGTRSPLRLLTTWRYDKPEDMWTLSLGDNISASTAWTQAVNYGGVQWGTNFTTQPNFITFAQPAIRGQATVPSTVDIYVNSLLRQHQPIVPGPYSLTNIPFVTGQGNVRVVTTDIQGRQQVITIPFYASNQLLKAGLTNYTYEFGMLRQNLGVTNFGYQRFLAAGTKTTGIRDDLTLQWHVEFMSDQGTAGGGFFKQIFDWGVLNGSAAASHINGGRKNGGLLLAGFQRQTLTYSFSVSSQITTLNFTQEGLTAGQLSPRLINQISAGTTVNNNSLGVSYIRQINRNQPGVNLLTASYSRNIFYGINLGLTGMTNLGGPKQKGILLTLTKALNDTTTLNVANGEQNGIHQESIQVIRSLPAGPGYGYNLIGSTGTNMSSNKVASLSLQNDIATLISQYNNNQGQEGYSFNLTGSAVLLDGHPHLTRALNNYSFGVVKVQGVKDVAVYVNNQLTARTDKNGNALVPNLLPYQKSIVSIDPTTVPLNATIDATSVTVAPYYSSGILIPFAVKVMRSAMLVIKQENGDNIPEGALVTLKGQKEQFLVGSEGGTYLTGLEDNNTAEISWEEEKQCQFSFKAPPSNPKDPIPNIGTFTCEGANKHADNSKATVTSNLPPRSP